MKYKVTLQEAKEVTQVTVTAEEPRLAWEMGLSAMGYAPHKFSTSMDQAASNVRRVVYMSIGLGGSVVTGLVKMVQS